MASVNPDYFHKSTYLELDNRFNIFSHDYLNKITRTKVRKCIYHTYVPLLSIHIQDVDL